METAKSQLSPPLKQMLAGFILPGLGHVLQGRHKRAALFAICIYGMWISGMLISNMTAIDPNAHEVYWWLTQFSAGLPSWIANWGGLANEALIGDNVSVNAQMIGITYVGMAGLSNLLSIMELVRHDPRLAEGDNDTGALEDAASPKESA